MSRDQISRFVEESIGLGWKWDVIKLRGGEPTLHPELFEVIELLERYHKVNPDCKFHILTNGFSEETKWILTKMPKWISVDNSEKKILSKTTIGKLRHDSFNIAPIDLWIYKLADYTKGCWRPSHCGMALSRYGYYPCAAGIHVSRVFGVEVGIKKLGQVNEERFLKVLNSLCRYCGHYKQPNDSTARNVISKSWRDAFNKYKESKPNLSLY
jgi:sulfatase maturation enzyme AslB (radical SAM superfamily)